MTKTGGEKKVVKKGKKKRKKKASSKKYLKYKIEGDKIIRQRTCPRCGPGIFLAIGKERAIAASAITLNFLRKNKK
mgnify:CR=1 FL=1